MKNHIYTPPVGISLLISFILIAFANNAIAGLYVIDEFKFYAEPRNEELDDSHISIMGFTIGKDSLSDIQSKIGKTEILPRKEQAPNQICYVSDQESDGTMIIFSAGPMGGWKYMTSFSLVSDQKAMETAKCRKSALVSRSIQTDSGIKLGMSKNELIKILGTPEKEIGDRMFFLYSTKDKTNNKLDISSTIVATFSNAKMSSVMISKVVSN